MDKPSWDMAPSWADYLAQDNNGSWYWFEYRPTFNSVKGTWNSDEGLWISHLAHLSDLFADNSTLERRP